MRRIQVIRDECMRISEGPNRQQFVDQPKIPDFLRPRETTEKTQPAPPAPKADGLV